MPRSHAEALLSSPIGLQPLELAAGGRATLSPEQLDALLAQLRFHHSRHLPDYDDHVMALKSHATELEPVARWLAGSMARWWSDLDRNAQVWAKRTPDPPEPSRFVPDLSRMHDEAPKPRRALWTSTRTAPSPAPWLDHPERPDVVHLWRLTVSPAARVAEVHSPEDWFALAHAHPARAPGYVFTGMKDRPSSAQRLDPDWKKVAEQWDAVHLSVGGWLTAEDVPYGPGGERTELRGWEMESTVWLRWSFSSVEALEPA